MRVGYLLTHRDMALSNESHLQERQLQLLDVHIVDILAHLEALLRNTHSIQRALLQRRNAAPPPSRESPEAALDHARSHAQEMHRECTMLSQIVEDVACGLD